MGNATTFAQLTARAESEKIVLAEILLSELLHDWTKTGGYTYVYELAYLNETITLADGTTEIVRKVLKEVQQNTISYTEKISIAEVEATASTFWHDTANSTLYIHTSDGTAPGGFTIMGRFWLYTATTPEVLSSPSCLSFDSASDEYVSLPNNMVDISAGCSASMWLYLVSTPSHENPRYFSLYETVPAHAVGIMIEEQDTASPNILVNASTAAATYMECAAHLAFNTWYHIVFTFDGATTFTLYVDGVLQSLVAGTSRGLATFSAIGGGYSATSYCAHGRMHEVRLYNTVLTQANVTALYSNKDFPATGLIGYWPLNEGSGTIANDVSGSNFVGTLTNTPTWLPQGHIDGDKFGRQYEALLDANSIPQISQEVQGVRYGVVTISGGAIQLENAHGFFDQISRLFVWAGATIRLLIGGDSLPYSEYYLFFKGKIHDPQFTNMAWSLKLKAASYDLLRSVPVNNFWTSTYANLDPAAEGREIPLYYGSYSSTQAPIVTCVNSAYAASTYQFKICDTTYYGIKSITQVYVDYGAGAGWQTIAHSNENLAAATFTINTVSFVVGTSRVKVAFEGYHVASVLIEGAPEIVEDILTTWCGVAAADIDSISFTASKTASTYALNVPIEKGTSVLTIIETICATDLAYFSETAAGKFRYVSWVPIPASSVVDGISSTDILAIRFVDDMETLFWRIRIGYSYDPATDGYLYSTDQTDLTKYKYRIDETLRILTYHRNSAGADELSAHLNILTRELLTVAKFTMPITEIDKIVGNTLLLTLTRSPNATSGGLASKPFEIIRKTISAFPAQVYFEARDMTQYAESIGYWTGPAAPAWAAATATEKDSQGFWADANGWIDPADETTKNQSLWW